MTQIAECTTNNPEIKLQHIISKQHGIKQNIHKTKSVCLHHEYKFCHVLYRIYTKYIMKFIYSEKQQIIHAYIEITNSLV